MGDGIAHLGVGEGLYVRHDEADLTRRQVGALHRVRGEHTDLQYFVNSASRHELYAFTLAKRAVLDAHQDDHADVGVEPGIKNKRLKRSSAVA